MSYKKSFWTTFVFLAGGVFLLASTVFADTVEQGLVQVPAPIKDRTRAMIQKGIPSEDAIQLIQAMNANRFQEEQILKAQAIVLEAQGRGLPTKPVINKAFEGMAKQVAPERTLQAMEAVSARYAFAFDQARSITKNAEQAGRLGNMLAESLAAGLKEQDASQVMSQLQEQSPKMNQDQMDELAAACLAMARDMSRLVFLPLCPPRSFRVHYPMGLTQPALRACISPYLPNHRLILRKPWPRGWRMECSRPVFAGTGRYGRRAVRARRGDLEQGLIWASRRDAMAIAQRAHQDAAAAVTTAPNRTGGSAGARQSSRMVYPTPRTDLISVSPGTSSLRRR